jgi:hypothetical protein
VARTYVLKRIPLWPVIKMSFVLFIILGVIIGIFYALLLSLSGFFASALSSSLGGEFGFMKGLGFVLIPVFAIIYGIFGTIAVAIWALVYNLIASIVGGVEFDLEIVENRRIVSAAHAAPAPSGPEGIQPPGGKTINGF